MDEKAKRILTNNIFMTLATVDTDGQPWSTPVFYALDQKYNFYWYSRKDTRHSQNIQINNKVSVSIFSEEGRDRLTGVYIEGIAQELKEEELPIATKIYAEKAASSEEEKVQLTTVEDFIEESPLRMYKFVPTKIYISVDATKWNGKWIDIREEVSL